jgi:hypothetical protein
MAGTGLAVILALNMEIGSVGMPTSDAEDASVEAAGLQQVPRQPTGRTGLMAFILQSEAADAGASRPDPEALLTQAPLRVPQRPLNTQAEEPDETGTQPQLRLVFRLPDTPDRDDGDGGPAVADDAAPPSGTAPGEPS